MPDKLALQVGHRVRKLRKEQEFSFDAFVEETGLGRGYISELERGLVVPSLHTLHRLAAALEVPVADLILGDSLREEIFALMRGWPTVELQRLRRVVFSTQQHLEGRRPGAKARRTGEDGYPAPSVRPVSLVAEAQRRK